MPADVVIGQKWSIWFPSRRQWLLAAVTGRSEGKATLQCDVRYGITSGDDVVHADEVSMLSASNLFRFIAP